MARQYVMIVREWDAETPEVAQEMAMAAELPFVGTFVVWAASSVYDLPHPSQSPIWEIVEDR